MNLVFDTVLIEGLKYYSEDIVVLLAMVMAVLIHVIPATCVFLVDSFKSIIVKLKMWISD